MRDSAPRELPRHGLDPRGHMRIVHGPRGSKQQAHAWGVCTLIYFENDGVHPHTTLSLCPLRPFVLYSP